MIRQALDTFPSSSASLSSDNFLRVLCGKAVMRFSSGEWVISRFPIYSEGRVAAFCCQGAVLGATVGELPNYLNMLQSVLARAEALLRDFSAGHISREESRLTSSRRPSPSYRM